MPAPNAAHWLAAKDRELSAREAAVIEALGPAMAEATEAIEELVAGLPEGSPSRDLAWTAAQPQLAAILARLNDKVAAAIGQALLVAQKPLRELAAEWMSGPVDLPYLSASELLAAIVVGEATLAEWFRRRSPSRWMEGLIATVNNAVAAGWAREQAARDLAGEVVASASAAIGRAVLAMTRTGLWAAADREQQRVWWADQGEQEWVWVSRRDEKVCPVCWSLDAQEAANREELSDCPGHIACRCSVLRVE
jgi:hypothetical protein